MKKLFSLLLLVAFTFTCFAQTDTTKQLPDSAKLSYSKVYNDVKAGIAGLASALKVGAAHVYEVLVKQQIVYSVANLLGYIVFILLARFFALNFIKNEKRTRDKDDDWYRDDWDDHVCIIGSFVAAILLGVIGLIFFGCTISGTITGFINPEYGAIKEIIDFVK